MKNIFTVNRFSFALIGLVTGFIIAFAEPYRYDEHLGLWSHLLLLVPGLLFGLPMIYYIAAFSIQKKYLRYLTFILAAIVAFPVSVYIVTYGAPLALISMPLLALAFFISGAAGAVLIGFGISRFVSLKIKNYMWLAFLGGVPAAVILFFAIPSWGESSPDAIFWLYPVWQTVVGFYAGLLLENAFLRPAESSDKAAWFYGAKKHIAAGIAVLIILAVLFKIFPTFIPDDTEAKLLARASVMTDINICRNYQALYDRGHFLGFLTPFYFTDLTKIGKKMNGMEDLSNVIIDENGMKAIVDGKQDCSIEIINDAEGNFLENKKTCTDKIPNFVSGMPDDRCIFEIMKIEGINSEERYYQIKYGDFISVL